MLRKSKNTNEQVSARTWTIILKEDGFLTLYAEICVLLVNIIVFQQVVK